MQLYQRPVTKKEKINGYPSDQVLPLFDDKNRRTRRQSLIPHNLASFLHPHFSKGRKSLFRQSDARGFLKYLILVPLSVVGSMAFTAYTWVPLLEKRGIFANLEQAFLGSLQEPLFQFLLALSFLIYFVSDLATEAWTFVMLLRGLRRSPHPKTLPNLVHVVVVCQYKEPLEVLAATIDSISTNTKATNTIVCMASEERDETAKEKFESLRTSYGHCFRDFLSTYHRLESGEIIGKSSNENYAVRQIYSYAMQQGLDPFEVSSSTKNKETSASN